jgi:hypothetical protein
MKNGRSEEHPVQSAKILRRDPRRWTLCDLPGCTREFEMDSLRERGEEWEEHAREHATRYCSPGGSPVDCHMSYGAIFLRLLLVISHFKVVTYYSTVASHNKSREL